jgi:hypothetical protein
LCTCGALQAAARGRSTAALGGMSPALSKVLVMAEALLIGVPLGLIFLPVALMSVFVTPLAIPLLLVLGSSFVAAMVTMARFIDAGADGLRQLRKRWWVLYTAGATVVVAGWLVYVVVTRPGRQVSEELGFALFVTAFGTPMLVPYAHLLLERQLRKEASDAA